MAEAARAVEAAGADLVDINMGCPVPKICKTGAGAALLADPARPSRLVAAMVRAVDIPVTVKMRRGLTPQDSTPAETARHFAAAGAAALCFHPRAAAEEYEGRADHRLTAEVVAAVDVPVIASGDIATPGRRPPGAGGHGVRGRRRGPRRPRLSLGLRRHPRRGRAAPPRPGRGGGRDRPPSPPTRGSPSASRGPTGYMRKFYGWYLAGHDLPTGELEALLTTPTPGRRPRAPAVARRRPGRRLNPPGGAATLRRRPARSRHTEGDPPRWTAK